MMSVGLEHYLVLSAVLFCIGLYGALVKRNTVVILMCIEIMLNAVNIALVAFARYLVPEPPDPVVYSGQIFVIFVMVVAAAEAAVGLALIVSIYRSRRTVDATEIDLMKG
ncbi:MAG: NADH-quinone oxidoreductase subunit NuoK [Chloroflexi bacterium]|nr:NADH-quinone oxidoreductase subunit NuoK [Chloroflexota bacterium]